MRVTFYLLLAPIFSGSILICSDSPKQRGVIVVQYSSVDGTVLSSGEYSIINDLPKFHKDLNDNSILKKAVEFFLDEQMRPMIFVPATMTRVVEVDQRTNSSDQPSQNVFRCICDFLCCYRSVR